MKTVIELFEKVLQILSLLPDKLSAEKLEALQKIAAILLNKEFKQSDCGKIHLLLISLSNEFHLDVAEQTSVMSRIHTLCN